MLEFNAVYFKESAPYNPGYYSSHFEAYSSVTTVDTITIVTTSTTFSRFCSVPVPRRCEAMKNGLLIARRPQAKIFGEVELDMLKNLKD